MRQWGARPQADNLGREGDRSIIAVGGAMVQGNMDSHGGVPSNYCSFTAASNTGLMLKKVAPMARSAWLSRTCRLSRYSCSPPSITSSMSV